MLKIQYLYQQITILIQYFFIIKSIAPDTNSKAWGKNTVLHSIGNYVGNILNSIGKYVGNILKNRPISRSNWEPMVNI